VHDNFFTGALPTQLLQGPAISLVYASNNYFTGSFENLAIISPYLVLVGLNNNLFSGPSLLPELCGLPLVGLQLADNSFSGSIPSCVGSWVAMEGLDLSSNRFEGSLPSSMYQMSVLETLVMHSNQFTGPGWIMFISVLFVSSHRQVLCCVFVVTNIFNNAKLKLLVIGDNQITGLLPVEIFNSSLLSVFIASKNCFSGPISSDICLAGNLETLGLSGLTSASSCTYQTSFGGHFVRAVEGGLPQCLFEMPNLVQLFAAGNKILDHLYDMAPNSKLENMSLSYNRLRGKIPVTIEQHTGFDVLDLSYNSLVGTVSNMGNYSLSSTDAHPTDLYLSRNLLSGYIPSKFMTASTPINILNGNMFQCHSTQDLPQGDPRAHSYSCGSDLLDVFVYMWAGLVLILVLGVAWCLLYGKNGTDSGAIINISGSLRQLLTFALFKPPAAAGSNTGAANAADALIRHSWLVLYMLRKFCAHATILIVLVFMPIFIGLSLSDERDAESQTYEYGWFVSIAFIKGEKSAIVVAVVWILFLLYCMYFEGKFISRTPLTTSKTPKARYVVSRANSLKQTVVLVGSLAVTMAVNGLYVWTRLTQSLPMQVVAAGLYAIYKTVIVYMALVPWMERMHFNFLGILSFIMMNVVVIPVLATLTVDSACFESLIVPEDDIVTHFAYDSCAHFTGTDRDHVSCVQYATTVLEVSTPAPFIYSHMCFTAVLTNYIPIYVLTYGVIGLLVPVAQIIATTYFANAAATENEQVIAWIHQVKALIWLPPVRHVLPLESITDMQTPDKTTRRHFYLSRNNSRNCVLLLTLLLSVGVTYSPLAMMLMLNIAVSTLAFQLSMYYHSKQIVGLPENCASLWCEVLRSEICDMQKVVFGSRFAIYCFSCCFVAFALYEMVENINAVSVVLIVLVVLLPTVGARALAHRRAAAMKEFEDKADSIRSDLRTSGNYVLGLELSDFFRLPSLVRRSEANTRLTELSDIWAQPQDEKDERPTSSFEDSMACGDASIHSVEVHNPLTSENQSSDSE